MNNLVSTDSSTGAIEHSIQIAGIRRENGIKLAPGDQLKVEISSDDKVLVGGIKDAKQARKLEEAIDKDISGGNNILEHADDVVENEFKGIM